MSLRAWLRNSWLVEHNASREETAALLAIVDRDIASAKIAGLAEDWQFNIAYNAALQAATAALGAAGFRAAREQHHYRTVQSLAFTLNWPTTKVAQFDRFRKKRNIVGYESAGVVSKQEAQEMHELAVALRADLIAWLRRQHPQLLKR